MQKIKLLQSVKTFNEKGEPIVFPFGSLFNFSIDFIKWIKDSKISHMVFNDNIVVKNGYRTEK